MFYMYGLNKRHKPGLFLYYFSLILSIIGVSFSFAETPPIYEINLINDEKIELSQGNESRAIIAIKTDSLKNEIQGNVPAKILADHDQFSFEDGRQHVLWHSDNSVADNTNNQQVYHTPYVYLNVDINDDIKNRNLSVIISKEENQSRLATVAAFFPQLLPVIFANDVAWGPAPTLFYEALMRWNYKVIGTDLSKLVRDVIATSAFDDKKTLLSQCTADFIEGFVLFELTNYGESVGNNRGKLNTFRHYMVTAPMKKVMDCMSRVLTDVVIELGENPEKESFKFLSKMNRTSIEGVSQLVVGYGFNTIAFQGINFFSELKKMIGFSSATDMNRFRFHDDIERSYLKAVQYTLQAGYEDLFKGLSKDYGFDNRLAYAMANGAGLIEMFARLYVYQNVSNTRHQFHSFTKRAEAMGVSLNRWIALPEFSDLQLLTMGIVFPVAAYTLPSLVKGHVSEGLFHLLNNLYEGITLGAMTYLIAPVLQRNAVLYVRNVQKPVLDYFGSGKGSWSEFALAEDIIYRIDLVIEDD